MDRPLCKICNHRHYASEAHVWKSKDFVVYEAPVESPKPVDQPVTLYGGAAGGSMASAATWPINSTGSRENRSRYRSPEAAEAYRAYMRGYMAQKRARKD